MCSPGSFHGFLSRMPTEEGQGGIRWPGRLTPLSSAFLLSPRAAYEVLHGSSSLDSGAAAGGCLGPGPHACPRPVSWAQGSFGVPLRKRARGKAVRDKWAGDEWCGPREEGGTP